MTKGYCLSAKSSSDSTISYHMFQDGKIIDGNCPNLWSQISAGSSNGCAISIDGDAYCWGENSYGAIGNNTSNDSLTPVAVTNSGALSGLKIKDISTSDGQFSCAIASDNNVYCWGQNNAYGLLGNNTTTISRVPVSIFKSGALNGLTIKSISTGTAHSCVIASNDNAYCWGRNDFGQLGNNSTTNSIVPVPVLTSGALAGLTIKKFPRGIYLHARLHLITMHIAGGRIAGMEFLALTARRAI